MKLSVTDFVGDWTIDRVIEDARNGATSHLSGRALFTPGDSGLIVDETGELRIPGQPPMQARRRYLWDQAGRDIAVRFDDGRRFHSFDPAARPCVAHHDCAPDLYRVRYAFGHWPEWRSEWQVSGPRKVYTMTTRYRRPAP